MPQRPPRRNRRSPTKDWNWSSATTTSRRVFPRVRRASSKACRTLESSVFRSTREYNPFNVAISPFLFELNSVIAMPCSLSVVSICSFQFQSDKKKRWRQWEEEEEGEGEEEEEEEEEEGEVGGRPTYLSFAFR